LAIALLIVLSFWMWIYPPAWLKFPQAPVGSTNSSEKSDQLVADRLAILLSPESQRSGTLKLEEETIDDAKLNAQFTVSFSVLQEIGYRISDEQIAEAENELLGLVTQLNELSDEEKLKFLNFFVESMRSSVIIPEAIVAFERLWSMLEKSTDVGLAASQILAPHYTTYYENTFAIKHFENIIDLGNELNTPQLGDLSKSYFRMHQYEEAIPFLHQYIDTVSSTNSTVDRLPFSQLFESYFRLGELAEAEIVGLRIIEEYNELQDWKDMQQFYESIGDLEGLQGHRNNAKAKGLLNNEGRWLE